MTAAKSVPAENALSSDKGAERIRTAVSHRLLNRQRGVYFIQEDSGPIKIGVTDDIVSRLRGLQSGNPRELHLLAYVPDASTWIEQGLHRRLVDHRIRGEWFEPHPDVFEAMDDLITVYGKAECDECERIKRCVIADHDPVRPSFAHTCGAKVAS